MSTPSPSEFLTFYRRVASPAFLRRVAGSPTSIPARSFITSTQSRNAKEDGGRSTADKDVGLGREHVLDKGPKKDPNVQSYESNKGREARASDTGGTATRQADESNSKQRTKEEFPEAPDNIGMQDERGGKGL